MRTLRAAILIGLVVLAPVATGLVGYSVGVESRRASPRPEWVDREVELTGASNLWVATVRCTYHLADGTTRRTQTATLIASIANAGSATERTCPPAP